MKSVGAAEVHVGIILVATSQLLLFDELGLNGLLKIPIDVASGVPYMFRS